MTFDGTQKVIGKGAQAEVLLYHGFAYKVFGKTDILRDHYRPISACALYWRIYRYFQKTV